MRASDGRHVRAAPVLCAAAIALLAATACARTVRGPADSPRWTPVLIDGFDGEGMVAESMYETRSSSPTWWLSSGAGLLVRDEIGSTLTGDAEPGYFRTRYAQRNPVDTDGGLHPQNLFRLVTRDAWTGDTLQQCRFRIRAYHLSASPQRYEANGLLLFSRYAGENDLYYAGIRVDGHAVVKKKSAGTYYTLAERPVFAGSYDREANPIALPRDEWLALRVMTEDRADGSVVVTLYMDRDGEGRWESLLRGVDAGVGGEPFREGCGGIRTDFMDVEFDDYAAFVSRNSR